MLQVGPPKVRDAAPWASSFLRIPCCVWGAKGKPIGKSTFVFGGGGIRFLAKTDSYLLG